MDCINIVASTLSPWKELELFQVKYLADETKCGATATFVGTMGDFNDGDGVNSMFRALP